MALQDAPVRGLLVGAAVNPQPAAGLPPSSHFPPAPPGCTGWCAFPPYAILGTWRFFPIPHQEIGPRSYDGMASRSDGERPRYLSNRGHARAGHIAAQGVSLVVLATHVCPKEAVWLVDAKPHAPSASPQRNAGHCWHGSARPSSLPGWPDGAALSS